jgi:hypothetical protein
MAHFKPKCFRESLIANDGELLRNITFINMRAYVLLYMNICLPQQFQVRLLDIPSAFIVCLYSEGN